ncbi:MAG: prolyl oligopeptidase family serine peptidase, partial [Clostridia bacterium]|nr:prolyl oligopeptidase family serine peptidase [Clostridia bacterium]
EGYKTTEDFAEEYGFILIAPTAYCKSSDYGEIRIYDETADEEKIAISLLGEKSAMAGLYYAETLVNVYPEHLYLMGQSMGGFGAAWIGNQYKELFDAIVICACIRDIEIYDYPNLVDMPIMFVKGTLDSASGGYEGSVELFHKMNAVLHNMVLVSAEGGEHSYGWAIGMPEWFAFLDAQY